MLQRANQTLRSVVDAAPTLPCAHHPGQQVLVRIAGHVNVKGSVAAVAFTDNGQTIYDVYVDEDSNEALLLRSVTSWRVASLPDNYGGAMTAGVKDTD